MTQRARNLTSAAVLAGVGVYWFITAAEFGPLSRLFPRVISVIVVVLAVCLAAMTLLGRGPAIVLAQGDAGERHGRSATLMASLILWTALIPLAGLLIASIVGVTVMGLITFRNHSGTIRAMIIALVLVAAFYFSFQEILNVTFPRSLIR